jgi:uncharacterized protein GlcG (DUF336 family)
LLVVTTCGLLAGAGGSAHGAQPAELPDWSGVWAPAPPPPPAKAVAGKAPEASAAGGVFGFGVPLLMNALCVGAALLPPFGMLDDSGHLIPVPSPAAMAAAPEPAAPAAPAAAPGPSLEVATEGARAAVETCAKQGVAIAVAVIDSQGKPRAMLMAEGSIGSVFVAMRKAVAALTFRMPTSELGDKLQKDKTMLARMTPVMFISGGGLPIWRGSELIGAIGSSGAHGAGPIGQLDEVCARAGLEKIEDRLRASRK